MISIFIITLFLLVVAVGIIVLVLVYQKKQLQYIAEKKQLTITYEKEILESKLEIQEHTFRNISLELHDNISQMLTLIKLNINTMSHKEPVALQNKIDNSRELIMNALENLRDISKSLHTDHIKDKGLSNSIEYELEMIRKTGAYAVQFYVTGEPYRLDDQAELIFFRITQESLHNIMKHAKATAIEVSIIFMPHLFTLHIKDNGTGFDASRLDGITHNQSGLGIRNMYTRAKLLNADFKLTSTINEGTIITLTFALPSPKI